MTTAGIPGLTHFATTAGRIRQFLSDPELLTLFFLLRLARIYTRLTRTRISLPTRAMRAGGLDRFVDNGRVFYAYRGACYPESIGHGNAMMHIRDVALRYCQGVGLDIGANLWPLPGAHGVNNRPEENAYELDRWADGSLDFVFSSHCLEHLTEWRKALSLWLRKLKSGGTVFLYLPHPSMTLWQPGSPWVGDDHVWSPSVEAIVPVLEAEGMEIVACDPGPDDYYSFHIVARRRA